MGGQDVTTHGTSSSELLQGFQCLEAIPNNASIFSCDDVSMYSNINSEACLKVMTEYLQRDSTRKRFTYNPDALIEAIEIILRSNVMKFGDIFVQQISGVAMGICPA
eukprot:scaffold16757_cov168-Skeletonema_dohrnii-CCMP3373.AAC.3